MEVSLVVPVHNEEGNLDTLVDRVSRVLVEGTFDRPIELVLVDDNSSDATPDICDRLATEYPFVSVVHRRGEPGFGNAIKAGLSAARGDILVPFMGDLSDDPADVPKLVAAIEDGYDVAYGSRFTPGGTVEGYPPLKLFYNRAFNNLIRFSFGIRAKDVTNAFTAYRAEVIEEIGVDNLDAESFDLTAELPLRAHILGFTSVEVPVTWRSRDAGVSKLNATRKGPLYLKRLIHIFVVGNVVGLTDLFGAIAAGNAARVFGAALFGVFILLALFSLSGFDGVFEAVSNTRPVWLVAVAVAYFGSFAFRTWRYRVLLRTSGYLADRGNVFRSILTGWFVNFILPARAGDAARGLALKSTSGVPFSVATGLVVVERILDMFVLGGAMLVLVTVFVDFRRAELLAVGALGIAAALLVGLGLLYVAEERLVDRLEGRFPRVRSGVAALKEALARTVRNPYAVALAGALSLPVWTLEASTLYFSARALGVTPTAVAAATAAVGAFVAQAVPVTPAGIGTYEATVTALFSLFGVAASTATAIGLVDHFVRVGVVYVLGSISAVHVGFRSRSYFRNRTETERSPVGESET